jgi:nucleoside-diphosphate-sugar epimerase
MILVTGSTGLLGSHLLIELAPLNLKIRATFREKSRIDQVRKLFHYYFDTNSDELFDKIEWVKADLLNLADLDTIFQGVEYVYHCSGKVSFFKSDFNNCFRQNRDVTANIVNYSLNFNIKKLCYVGSTAAIGMNPSGVTTELNKWENGNTISGYSVSKFSAEKEVWRGIEEGLNAVIINPCVILGPGNWNESSLTIFKTAQKGLLFYPTGCNAVVDARDVAKSMRLLMESTISSERFLCTGVNLSFKDLFSKLAQEFGNKPPSIEVPKWLSLTTAFISETIGRFTGNKSGLSIETAHSAYKTIIYDHSKIKNSIDIQFHSLEETFENTINFKQFDL